MILVDSNCLCHRAKHAMKGLSYGDMETGVIFGFLKDLLFLAKKFNDTHFLFAWDSRASKRKAIYPLYKANKTKKELTDEEIYLNDVSYAQFNEIRQEVLPKFGFTFNYIMTGYEGDDIIANILLNYKRLSIIPEDCVVVSSDEDLFQLIPFANQYSPHTKTLITVKDIPLVFTKWANIKALAGCQSDNVPGKVGIGTKKAIDYYKGEGSEKTRREITEWLKTPEAALMTKLVTLPFEGMPMLEFDFKNFSKEIFKRDDFVNICLEYDFKSFLREERDWVKTFNMV